MKVVEALEAVLSVPPMVVGVVLATGLGLLLSWHTWQRCPHCGRLARRVTQGWRRCRARGRRGRQHPRAHDRGGGRRARQPLGRPPGAHPAERLAHRDRQERELRGGRRRHGEGRDLGGAPGAAAGRAAGGRRPARRTPPRARGGGGGPGARAAAIRELESVLARYPSGAGATQAAYTLGNLRYAAGAYAGAHGAWEIALARAAGAPTLPP